LEDNPQMLIANHGRPAFSRIAVWLILLGSLFSLILFLPLPGGLPRLVIDDASFQYIQLFLLQLSFFVIGACIYFLRPGLLFLSFLSIGAGVILFPVWLFYFLFLPNPDDGDGYYSSEGKHGIYAGSQIVSAVYGNRNGQCSTTILLEKYLAPKLCLVKTLKTFPGNFDVCVKGIEHDRLMLSVNSEVKGMETLSLGQGRFQLTGRRIYGKSTYESIDLKPYALLGL